MRFPPTLNPDKNYRIARVLTKWCVETSALRRQSDKDGNIICLPSRRDIRVTKAPAAAAFR
jgi:hypothetical protein